MQSNRCHFVFIESAVKSHALKWDPDEELQVLTQPVDEVLALAHSGGIVHALVLNALMLFEPVWRAKKKR
jgi:ADP-ribose pyrophosphatase